MKLTFLARYFLLALLLAGSLLPAQSKRRTSAPPSDWQIEAQVQQIIADEHAFVGSSISSSVNQGVVKLTGNVRSEAEKELASTKLVGIRGVKTILNNLEIVDPTPKPATAPVVASAPAQPPAFTGQKLITLPLGSMLPVRLNESIHTKTAKVGDIFHAQTEANIFASGYTLIRTGTPVTGRVIEAKPAGRLSGTAELSIELVSIQLTTPTGVQEVAVQTQPLSSKSSSRGVNTAGKTAGGAALGAIVGGLAGGGTGAGIGAASGGALGLGVNALSHGKDIELKSEQVLQFRTAAPIEVAISLINGAQVLPQESKSQGVLQSRPTVAPQSSTEEKQP
jgi:hypothetical protein